ncbi:MAG: GDP-mannose 4,6-dehydratase [Anaerolineales bacterium]|nr:GDP-mannose 4,6-dehydratase [Anaerolineales bacterium]
MPTALITGIAGQDGSYLAELLLSKGYRVLGIDHLSSIATYEHLKHFQDDLTLLEGDLLDQGSLVAILEQYSPDEVYNFAALSFPEGSWSRPVVTGDITALGVTRMLEAIRLVCPKARFYQASSSEMFGVVREVPQTENTPFYPRNPYGVAKVYGHWITVTYREMHQIFACSGILYNHESPRRGLQYVTRKITHGAARIKLGLADEIRLGNLDARRDWGYAGDYVEAMWGMLQQDQPDDYVVCTGETHSVREFCEAAFSHVGLNYQDYVVQDERFYRPAEAKLLVGNPEKTQTKLGWKPRVSFEELVTMMVDFDLQYLGKEIL